MRQPTLRKFRNCFAVIYEVRRLLAARIGL
jgi:hypothetical protein